MYNPSFCIEAEFAKGIMNNILETYIMGMKGLVRFCWELIIWWMLEWGIVHIGYYNNSTIVINLFILESYRVVMMLFLTPLYFLSKSVHQCANLSYVYSFAHTSLFWRGAINEFFLAKGLVTF